MASVESVRDLVFPVHRAGEVDAVHVLLDEAFDAVEFPAVEFCLAERARGVGKRVRFHRLVGRKKLGVEVSFGGLAVAALAFEVKPLLEDGQRGGIVFGAKGSVFLLFLRLKLGIARLVGGHSGGSQLLVGGRFGCVPGSRLRRFGLRLRRGRRLLFRLGILCIRKECAKRQDRHQAHKQTRADKTERHEMQLRLMTKTKGNTP